MKTSIFDMNFTLPPMIEMSEVVLLGTGRTFLAGTYWYCTGC